MIDVFEAVTLPSLVRQTNTEFIWLIVIDTAMPAETPKAVAEQLKAAVPQMTINEVGAGGAENLLLNTTKPPFNDPRVRKAVSYAMDRRAFVKAVAQGAAVAGGALTLPPGLPPGLAGIIVNHAVGVVSPGGVIVGVSVAVSLTAVP